MSTLKSAAIAAPPWDAESLMEHAPEIARQIAAAWGDVSTTAALLEQLLVDDDVRYLEPAVASDLLRLYEIHARRQTCEAGDTSWELPVSRLQCNRINLI